MPLGSNFSGRGALVAEALGGTQSRGACCGSIPSGQGTASRLAGAAVVWLGLDANHKAIIQGKFSSTQPRRSGTAAGAGLAAGVAGDLVAATGAAVLAAVLAAGVVEDRGSAGTATGFGGTAGAGAGAGLTTDDGALGLGDGALLRLNELDEPPRLAVPASAEWDTASNTTAIAMTIHTILALITTDPAPGFVHDLTSLTLFTNYKPVSTDAAGFGHAVHAPADGI